MVKNPPATVGDMGLIPGSGSSPGEGNGNPFEYSCRGNSMNRGALWAMVHGGRGGGGYKELDMTKHLNNKK